jgi:hypothetical protein
MLLCVWGPQIAKLRMLIHWLVLSESEFWPLHSYDGWEGRKLKCAD